MFSSPATRKGPGRSHLNVPRITGRSGSKLAKKIHFGLCGLRNGVGLAGRLALEGKLCNKTKSGISR